MNNHNYLSDERSSLHNETDGYIHRHSHTSTATTTTTIATISSANASMTINEQKVHAYDQDLNLSHQHPYYDAPIPYIYFQKLPIQRQSASCSPSLVSNLQAPPLMQNMQSSYSEGLTRQHSNQLSYSYDYEPKFINAHQIFLEEQMHAYSILQPSMNTPSSSSTAPLSGTAFMFGNPPWYQHSLYNPIRPVTNIQSCVRNNFIIPTATYLEDTIPFTLMGNHTRRNYDETEGRDNGMATMSLCKHDCYTQSQPSAFKGCHEVDRKKKQKQASCTGGEQWPLFDEKLKTRLISKANLEKATGECHRRVTTSSITTVPFQAGSLQRLFKPLNEDASSFTYNRPVTDYNDGLTETIHLKSCKRASGGGKLLEKAYSNSKQLSAKVESSNTCLTTINKIEKELAFLWDECNSILIMLASLQNAFSAAHVDGSHKERNEDNVSMSTVEQSSTADLVIKKDITANQKTTAETKKPLFVVQNYNKQSDRRTTTRSKQNNSIASGSLSSLQIHTSATSFSLGQQQGYNTHEVNREMRLAYDDLKIQIKQLDRKVRNLEEKSVRVLRSIQSSQGGS